MKGGRPLQSDPGYCRECLAKQQRIDRLEEEVLRLKAKLCRQERTAKEEPFGLSTPSAKRLIKASTPAEQRAKKGGATPGHEGHGRQGVSEAEAASLERLDAPEVCPDCGTPLDFRGERDRTIIDCEPVRAVKRLVRITAGHCSKCRRTFRPRLHGVLPRSTCSNRLLAQTALWHYKDGLTLGHIARQFDLSKGMLIGRMHALADLMEPAMDRLIRDWRLAPVKHADETGWRCDGRNGYTHGFFTPDISLFRCRHTRSGDVAAEVFGEVPHLGTLVVDRYAAYNRFKGLIQYCLEHLKREIQKLTKDDPGHAECEQFESELVPLLAEAMGLRNDPMDESAFLVQAATIQARIELGMAAKARHPGIQRIQNIFRENAHRLYHWAKDRTIPAENNLAERALRPLVIARKISFGSQSEKGLHTREILMTLLGTLAKRTEHAVDAFVRVLDAVAENPALDLEDFLFGPQGIAPPRAPDPVAVRQV
jgi:transposase